jgi:uncharacterized repeat protein (TIGR01451 family)
MKQSSVVALMLLLFAFTMVGNVKAQEAGSIELKVVAEQELVTVDADGERQVTRVPAAKVVPGDEVIYTVTYENVGEKAAGSVVITNPIPEHMQYKDKSASGTGTAITFSVDGGKAYDTPGNLKVLDENGEEVPAKSSDYTHVRWRLEDPLAAGSQGSVNFKAILN